MEKLSRQEYILKAAKLYGLGDIEIGLLKDHLDGSMPNEFIVRRTKALFRLYDIYKSNQFNEHIDTDENGIINLNDYSIEISRRRLIDSKIGKFWIISSNLDAFLSVTTPQDIYSDVKEKFYDISEINNFFLPQLAKQMGIDATVYYKGEYKDANGTLSIHHLTKNFLYDQENLIQGSSIVKEEPKKNKIKFEALLESTDKFIKNHYKKHQLPEADLQRARKEIREGLIKQTFFNKLLLNENECNEKWGLIEGRDKSLRLAPIFSYDYFAGVESSSNPPHRTVQKNKEDIESFMITFSKEKWFRDWIKNDVLSLDFEKAQRDMMRVTGLDLSEKEKEYYKYLLDITYSKVLNVYNLNYDKSLIQNNKRKKITDNILDIKNTISRKIVNPKKFKGKDMDHNHEK